jgi:hypothetical protein
LDEARRIETPAIRGCEIRAGSMADAPGDFANGYHLLYDARLTQTSV